MGQYSRTASLWAMLKGLTSVFCSGQQTGGSGFNAGGLMLLGFNHVVIDILQYLEFSLVLQMVCI